MLATTQGNCKGTASGQTVVRRPSVAATAANKARVLLVDSHVLVRQAIAQVLDQEPDLSVSSGVSGAKGALDVVGKSKHDLVLLEINLRSDNGLELSRILNVRYPKLPVLVLSHLEEGLYAELALRAGAMGYVMKDEPMERLLLAIRRVLTGQFYLSDNLTSKFLRRQIGRGANKERRAAEALSDRELQVFQLLGQWRRTNEIAAQLHVSPKTVQYYRQRIREKLQLKPGIGLTQFAITCASNGIGQSSSAGNGLPTGSGPRC
jgi:DNA-binding NarL/FixJ family response regulator